MHSTGHTVWKQFFQVTSGHYRLWNTTVQLMEFWNSDETKLVQDWNFNLLLDIFGQDHLRERE